MGCTNSTPEEQEAKHRSAQIDRELRAFGREAESTIKLLLLGAGESGKSTFVKQMKIIHGDGYSEEELKSYKSTVHSNLLASMVAVIRAMEKLDIKLKNPSNQTHASAVLKFPIPLETGAVIPPEIGEAVKSLWKDDGFQECFKRGYDFQLSDSAPYYFGRMDVILDSAYIPDEQDVLRSRVQTTGVVETSFRDGKVTYKLFDVGGQRSERRKWIHCFDDVKAVLFVAALSGYDMTLFEDDATNRMEESLNLFQAICNNKFFERTSMILFLNKMDLFTEKIEKSDRHLRLFFPQYTGPDNNVPAAQDFIEKEFLARNMKKGKIVFPHFTTATDSGNIRVVFKVVLETIIRENLERANLF